MKIRKSIIAIAAIALALVGSYVYGVNSPEVVVDCGTLSGKGEVSFKLDGVVYVTQIECRGEWV